MKCQEQLESGSYVFLEAPEFSLSILKLLFVEKFVQGPNQNGTYFFASSFLQGGNERRDKKTNK